MIKYGTLRRQCEQCVKSPKVEKLLNLKAEKSQRSKQRASLIETTRTGQGSSHRPRRFPMVERVGIHKPNYLLPLFALGTLLCFVELNILMSAALSAVFLFIVRFLPPKPYLASLMKEKKSVFYKIYHTLVIDYLWFVDHSTDFAKQKREQRKKYSSGKYV